MALSVVPRHEQDDLDFAAGWCIGHVCPSPWSQVHSCTAVPAGIPAQSATGAPARTAAWEMSHAVTTHA